MPATVSEEVRKMIVATTHRYAKVRQIAIKYLNATITSFAALMCDRKIVFTLLEVLTLLRRSCEDELVDEVSRRKQDAIDFWLTSVWPTP
jgi:phosphatidylinositol 4-kinase